MGCAKSKNGEIKANTDTGKPTVFFVLGGPGSGKGTQCAKLAEKHGFVHLSAADLLREERDSGSETAAMINKFMVEGKLVPGEIAVQLMKKAMEKHGWNKKRYLIDGFPRGQENLDGWTRVMGDSVDVPFVVFFDANEDTMIERILERAKTSGRSDDNMESLKKRFATFNSESVPIVEYFEKKGKVRKINALHSIEEVNAEVVKVFKGYI